MNEYFNGIRMRVFNPFSTTPLSISLSGVSESDMVTINPRESLDYYISNETSTLKRRFDKLIRDTAKLQYRQREERSHREMMNMFLLPEQDRDPEDWEDDDYGSYTGLDSWTNESNINKRIADMSQPEICKAIGYLNKGAWAWGQRSKIVTLKRVLSEKRHGTA